ncbi:MAG: DUF4129 domain-containing protein [Thermoplasmata archaeon]|nr:DUF4129 domain-containing protein [Thermoplasmata archaeon]
MAGRPVPRPSPLSPVAIAVVLAAVFFGVAAALLSGAPPTPTQLPPSHGTFIDYGDLVIVSWLIIGAVAAWIVYRVVLRVRNPSGGALNSFVVVWFVVLLLVLGFIVAVHFFGPAAPAQNGTGLNRTGNSTAPPGGTPVNTTPNGSVGNFTLGSHTFPGWSAYVLVLGVAAVSAIVALQVARSLGARSRSEREGLADPTEVARAAIVETLAKLEADPNADPRALVVALYARLLATVDAQLIETSARTAREIETVAVQRWKLPPEAARDLTRLFEEARYSPHRIGRVETERARAALQKILEIIDRSVVR